MKRLAVLGPAMLVVAAITVTAPRADSTTQAAATAAALVPVVPARVADTREGSPAGRLAAGATLAVRVAGVGEVPETAAAVMLNVTAVSPDAAGFLTVYECQGDRPFASHVNYLPGAIAPNAVLSGIGDNGSVCIYSMAATDVIVDVNGYVPEGGSMRPVVPARAADTREGTPTGRLSAGGTLKVKVVGVGGVRGDASAVMLNVTAVSPGAAGFLTVFACGAAQPNASHVNYMPGSVSPNAVLSGVGDGGAVCIYSMAATDVIVDVNGYVPSGGSMSPVVPARLADTREGTPTGRLAAGDTLAVGVTGSGGVPAGASAVMLNVTAVSPGAPGFLTVFPCGKAQPLASHVNYLAGDVSPNAVLSGVGAGGAVCIYSMAATDVIVDVNGYVTGGGTGGGPTPNTEVDGLKFDIDGAAGLGLAEQAVSSNTLGSRGSRLADGSGSSNLLAVEPDGSMRPAIDVGSVHIEHLQIGPDDKVYAVIATEPGECILIVIDSDTGVATCVDDTLMVVDIAEDGTFVQFDEAGGVYYKGYDMDSPMPLIRRNDDGVITDYVNDNQWIDDWLVTSDAAIFLRGQTLSTSASWLRRVSPTGGLATIVNGYVPFMHVFPDGNVYFGVHNDPIGVRRFNVAMGSLDPVNYIGPACDDPCAAPVFAVNDPTPYAENGEWGFTSDGRVFSGTDYATPRQLFPAPLEVATQVEKTQRLLGLSSTLLISGTDALDRNILTEIDPADGTEAVLIDPDVVGEVEVYHLGYNETENKVIFDGLRFSDNKYVVGFIDPQTGEVVTTPAPGGKLVDLQAFS